MIGPLGDFILALVTLEYMIGSIEAKLRQSVPHTRLSNIPFGDFTFTSFEMAGLEKCTFDFFSQHKRKKKLNTSTFKTFKTDEDEVIKFGTKPLDIYENECYWV